MTIENLGPGPIRPSPGSPLQQTHLRAEQVSRIAKSTFNILADISPFIKMRMT